MHLIEVKTAEHQQEFIDFAHSLYAGDQAYIRPLNQDINQVFDRENNPTFHRGDCIRWLLTDAEGTIGRIAAFVVDRKAVDSELESTGGIGFFECSPSQEAANLLFDTAKKWLIERGASYMDGPINFGRRDKWWGLLTIGYDLEPNYNCNYHLPYYKELFENYGFQVYYEHYTFRKDTRVMVDQKLQRKASMVAENPDYDVRSFDMKNFKKQVADIVDIYNKAWVKHEGVSGLSYEQAIKMFKRMKPIIDPRIMWLIYYKDQPIAFYLNIPEVNQIFKHLNGKMSLIGTLKFLWYKLTMKNTKMLGIVFGIVPEHQGKGVDGSLAMTCYNAMKTMPGLYDNLEINGIGDFNRKMIIVVKQVGGEICKVHSTYRYYFDRETPFERMKPIR
ncbi:hypothetical protein [Aureitalea marina]|uniref:N-acetyltransferase domain-containing protein n=1 Tax=Aureitalea marina TaxID=930804 RepID=A0A2S7KQF3_9FLAO|nr:hypothetical protein [Aureitalea marina]PQB04854.1 hypothetical protein BST85_08100 [Aureitalea marina]